MAKHMTLDTRKGIAHGLGCGLMLAFLRDAKTSQTTTRIFNMLQDTAGLEFFMTLFPVVLGDNGPEFMREADNAILRKKGVVE